MKTNLYTIAALAERALPDPDAGNIIRIEVTDDNDDVLADGYYDPHNRRARALVGQSIGKLLSAGYFVTTYRCTPLPESSKRDSPKKPTTSCS